MENLFDLDFSRWNDILLSIVPALINAGIFLYIHFFLPKSRTNNSFSLFVLLVCLWQLAEGFTRMSFTAEAAFEWVKLSEVLLLLVIPFGILFILHFSDWHKKTPDSLLFPFLFFPTTITLFCVIARLDKFTMIRSEQWHWIANPIPTFITLVVYVWLAVGTLLMLALLWFFYAKTKKDDWKRKQLLSLALGFTLPVVLGVGMEIVFPLVFQLNDVPVTASLVTLFSITALVAITKYKLLDFSPRHQWDQIAESMREGILIVNNEGKIMYVNEPLCKLLGYNSEELLGTVAGELFFDSSEKIKKIEQVTAARTHKQSGQYEIQIKTRSGERIWMIVSTSPYLDSNGKQIGAIGIHTDITDRKRVEEALIDKERLLEDAQRLAYTGSWSWDIDRDEIQWSKELYAITGLNPQLPPPNFTDLASSFTKESWKILAEAIGKTMSEGTPYELELDMLCSDGLIRHTNTKGAGVKDKTGHVVRLYGTTQDITERKAAEEKVAEPEEEPKEESESEYVAESD